jgi:DNA repair exonuclease SbcCD ATPase subunit
MSYRPHNLAIKMTDEGEDIMSHKPNETTTVPDTSQLEKPRVVSVSSSKNGQSAQERSNRTTPIRPNVLDQKLRDAEASLQQLESTKTKAMDMAETMGAAGLGNVDKIRDILFGGQMRDYDKRFKRVEDRFVQENMNFREEMFQRLKVLEERMDSEIESLTEKGKLERQERQAALTEVERDIKALKNELNTRLTQMDEQITRDIRNLRQQTLSKFQELTMQLRQQNENLTSLLNQEVNQLHDEKVNRSDLAAYFNEIAVRLTKTYENSHEDDIGLE